MTALNYEKDDTIIEITKNKKIDNYHILNRSSLRNKIYLIESSKRR